jgi:hypothetical protein
MVIAMTDELDRELSRLFAAVREPLADLGFSAQLMLKIGRARRIRLAQQILTVAGIVILALVNLRPAVELAGGAVRMIGEASPTSSQWPATPWGWVVSMLAGAWLLLRLRLSRR